MNKNLLTYLTALTLSAFTLTGCYDYDPADLPGDAEGNSLTLRIRMATPASHSRATSNPTGGENGDGWRIGRCNENNIYNVYLYKYSSPDGINASDETSTTLLASETGINFRPSPSDADGNGIIQKDVEFNVGAYQYKSSNNDHFIVCVNTENLGASPTLGALRNSTISHTCVQLGSLTKNYDNFTMANAGDSRFEGGQGTKDNPYLVSVDVERTTARLDFAYSTAAMTAGDFRIENGTYIYKALGTTADEVHLTHVRPTNVMKAPSYLIKRLAASKTDAPRYLADENDPAAKYVVEPTTWDKTIAAAEASTLEMDTWFGNSWYMNAVNDYASTTFPWFRPEDRVHVGTGDAFTDGTTLDEVDHDWNYYVLDYANENTMLADQTYQHYTTGLVLKATYLPAEIYKAVDPGTGALTLDDAYTKGTTFWRHHDVDSNEDVFFSNEAAAQAYKALHPYGLVYPYTDGQCYYNVWLRHENIIDDPTTTTMEFGIVRNNIYRVCVEFTGVGMPDVPEEMTTPENIRMFIYVRKWNLIDHPTIEI